MNRPCHNLLVTGGAGFIGGAFIRHLLSAEPSVSRIVNLDVLTYAGNLRNLIDIDTDPRYYFVQGDINDEALVES
ncbi:MAG: GDP-mannose 4,6-dehydratase, partial [Chlamydiia bacterium]